MKVHVTTLTSILKQSINSYLRNNEPCMAMKAAIILNEVYSHEIGIIELVESESQESPIIKGHR